MEECLYLASQYRWPVLDLNFFTLTHSAPMSDGVYFQSVCTVPFFSWPSEHWLPKLPSLPAPTDIVPWVPGQGCLFLETIWEGRISLTSFQPFHISGSGQGPPGQRTKWEDSGKGKRIQQNTWWEEESMIEASSARKNESNSILLGKHRVLLK